MFENCFSARIKFVRFGQLLLLALLILAALQVPSAANAQTGDNFLQRAISLAQHSQRETGVPASVTLAQAIWETGRGASPIGSANNYFGIKAGGSSDASVVVGPIASGWVWAWTKEWDGTRYVDKRERFRAYKNMEDSFRDHALLLATGARYANAMRAVDDPREFARRIAAAGYATSPTYARDLIRVMDDENLYQYDLPRNAFEMVGQSETFEVYAGEIFQIYFDVKNTGFGTWSPAAEYYLASANDNRFSAAARHELAQLVPPEHVNRWVLTMIAPNQAGTYSTVWQMKHGNQNFGEPLTVQVRVRALPLPQIWFWLGGFCVLALLGVSALLLFGYARYKKKTLHSRPV